MKLVIIEGPGKRETLKKYLGQGYEVFATKGHVRDLPAKDFGVDLRTIVPKYEIMEDKVDLIAELKKKAKKADEVLIATDPDREGEAIAWHIANILEIDPQTKCRIEFNEISKKAVTEALSKPRAINMDLVNAQQTRRILDRIVGYKLSPIICKRIKPKLSAGRVQSVALKLVCDRENEINAFVPEEYWNISADLENKEKAKFKAALNTIDGKKAKVSNEEEANKINSIQEKPLQTKPNQTKSNEELANEVIAGKWGNGADRKTRLTNAGYDFSAIQDIVNEKLLGNKTSSKPSKTIEELAREVIRGDWGNGTDRKTRLTNAGYNYDAIQNRVNEILK